MWTIVRFALRREQDYRAAFEILRHAGLLPHHRPGTCDGGAFPAAVVANVFQDPAVITRAVFEGLDEAGLLPVAVAACHVGVAEGGVAPRALASA